VSGSGSGVEALLERLVAEVQGLRQEVKTGFREFQMEVKEIRRTGRGIIKDVAALKDHFLEEERKSEAVSGEADEAQN
jgi:hypothetical protein